MLPAVHVLGRLSPDSEQRELFAAFGIIFPIVGLVGQREAK